MTRIEDKLILLSGTGRNSGKTTLICKIINFLKETHDVYALKITTHFHGTNTHTPDFRGERFSIWIEYTAPEGKDTWRMMQAGARLVFYVECDPDKVFEAYGVVRNYLPPDSLVVCESGGLRYDLIPALFVMANNCEKPKESALKLLPYADEVLPFSEIVQLNELDIELLLSRYVQL